MLGIRPGLDRQVVTHEAVELDRIFGVAEALLHRIPILAIDLRLVLAVQAHEDVVADQVGLGEVQARWNSGSRR